MEAVGAAAPARLCRTPVCGADRTTGQPLGCCPVRPVRTIRTNCPCPAMSGLSGFSIKSLKSRVLRIGLEIITFVRCHRHRLRISHAVKWPPDKLLSGFRGRNTAADKADSGGCPAFVRRVRSSLGDPDEVVARADEGLLLELLRSPLERFTLRFRIAGLCDGARFDV